MRINIDLSEQMEEKDLRQQMKGRRKCVCFLSIQLADIQLSKFNIKVLQRPKFLFLLRIWTDASHTMTCKYIGTGTVSVP
jgi:hypothetical protein